MLNYNTKRTDRMKKCILLLALPLLATDWPQWRGVERNGISPLDLHDEVVHIECHLYMCHY